MADKYHLISSLFVSAHIKLGREQNVGEICLDFLNGTIKDLHFALFRLYIFALLPQLEQNLRQYLSDRIFLVQEGRHVCVHYLPL